MCEEPGNRTIATNCDKGILELKLSVSECIAESLRNNELHNT